MTTARSRIRSARAGFSSWWEKTFFVEESTASVAVIRLLTGVLLVFWAVSLTPDFTAFFGQDPIAPSSTMSNGRWSLLTLWDSDGAAVALYFLLILSGVAVAIGWHTRLAAALAFIVLVSVDRKNPYVLNAGDVLLRHITFFTLLAPGGVALSVAARNRHGTIWAFPPRLAWPRRLMQVQLSVIYIATVIGKLGGDTWQEGTAVGYALRIGDMVRIPLPGLVLDNLLLVNLLTFGTLLVEFALGVLIWNRRLRPWVLLAGLLFHLSIDLTLMVGFFSPAILVLYVAFIEPEEMEAFLERMRLRLVARVRPVPAPAE